MYRTDGPVFYQRYPICLTNISHTIFKNAYLIEIECIFCYLVYKIIVFSVIEITYESKGFDHLGLINGMIDELGLVEVIDSYLSTDGVEREVSLDILCKVLITNDLGFSQRTLYMVSSFFR